MLLPGSVIEYSEHGHNAVGVAISAPNIAPCRPDVVHGQPNTASTLGYACTLLQCVINALQPACTACDKTLLRTFCATVVTLCALLHVFHSCICAAAHTPALTQTQKELH